MLRQPHERAESRGRPSGIKTFSMRGSRGLRGGAAVATMAATVAGAAYDAIKTKRKASKNAAEAQILCLSKGHRMKKTKWEWNNRLRNAIWKWNLEELKNEDYELTI